MNQCSRCGRGDKSSLAERLHDGSFAESTIEDNLDNMWPDKVLKVGHDYYDNSLEVYFHPDIDPGWSISSEQAERILGWGFFRLFLNFTDGTEQHVDRVKYDREAGVYQIKIGKRHSVQSPRWTAAKAQECL